MFYHNDDGSISKALANIADSGALGYSMINRSIKSTIPHWDGEISSLRIPWLLAVGFHFTKVGESLKWFLIMLRLHSLN